MSDTFRKEYRTVSDDQWDAIDGIKESAADIEKMIDASCVDARCAAIAKTKLEEAVMWAVKGITA